MKLSKREKVLLGILAITALVYLFYNFYYKPLSTEKVQLSNDNSSLRILIQKGEAARTEKVVLEKEEEKIKQDYKELLAAVPSSARVPETIAFLQKNSQDTNVYLLSIKYVPLKKSAGSRIEEQKNKQVAAGIPDKVQETSFSISARGSYNNLMAFMLKLENAPCLYIIKNCKLLASAKKNDDSLFNQVIQPAEGEEPISPLPVPALPLPQGSALYDGSSIILDLEFSAFYYNDDLPESANQADDEVEPGQGSINPFLK